MREHRVPAFTVDGHRPLGAFDLIGVSFATELGYTNLLDLPRPGRHPAARRATATADAPGGRRRRARRLQPGAGGRRSSTCAAIGDGEEVVGDITDVVKAWKAAGTARWPARAAAAARRGRGLLRPVALRGLATARTARSPRCEPVDERAPATVTKRTTTDLDAWPYPKAPLVPLAETVHERASVEIFRGCTRGCRFCQAGMITRPVRERSLRRRRRDGRRRGAGQRVRRGRAAVAELGRPLRDRRDHQGPGRPLRGHQHLAVAALAPGWTRSTSTWPRRSPATAAAPGSPSPPRAAPSGSAG